MKKIIVLLFAALILVFACKSIPHENPGVGPELTVGIPEDDFAPDPDADNKLTISIAVNHPVPIKDWNIRIQPNRGGQRPEGAGQSGQTERVRRIFFEQNGKGNVPTSWDWNGRGTNGELVQSATLYRFVLFVNDVFNNNTIFEGNISTDVIVRKEGDKLRIVVPSIIFPADQSDLSLVTDDDDRRSNERVLRLIARALNRYSDYKITVEGHANPTQRPGTTAGTNEETRELRPLSLARAQAVINYLVENNDINRERLNAIGLGGTRTVAPWNDTEENWKNRRVEFILEQ